MYRALHTHRLFLTLSAYVFVQGIVAVAEDTPLSVYGAVTLWFLGILAVQGAMLGLLSRRGVADLLVQALAALLVAANTVAFYLAFFAEFVSRSTLVQVLLALGLWGVALLVLEVGRKWAVVGTTLVAILAINMGVTVGYAVQRHVTPDTVVHDDTVTRQLAPYRDVVFHQSPDTRLPNVHLIGIDALMPEALARRFLNIQTDYHSLLHERGATIFKNLFASRAPTVGSLSSVARLADPNFSGSHGFAGRTLEPLYFIFRNNGYRISSGYGSGKEAFGDQGAFVDEYVNAHVSGRVLAESALCKYQGAVERRYQLFGFCAVVDQFEPVRGVPWGRAVINRIGRKGASDTPWLTFHYVYHVMGHTSKAHRSHSREDLQTYRVFFQEKQTQFTAHWLTDLLARIASDDPGSIVFVFGDHGPWLSRTVNPNQDARFFVQDRHGVFGAVLATDHRCARGDHLDHYFTRYGTLERVVAGVIRCLAVDPETVDRAVRFREVTDFSAFIYE